MKRVVYAMIAIIAFLTVGTVKAETKSSIELGKMGWVVEKMAVGEVPYLIRNVGANKGVIELGCASPGEDVYLKYTYRGGPKDLFIVELLTDGVIDTFPYLALYGLKSMNQEAVFKQFAKTDSGFMVTRFANGASERFFKSRQDRDVYGVPKPMGSELFVGHERVADFIAGIKLTCAAADENIY